MSQIFKSSIDKSLLFNFLEKICHKTEKYYLFDINAYKRLSLEKNILSDFCDSLKKHYHKSKIFYIERELNYNKLCTVIRQICNFNSVLFCRKIVYSKSKYDIPYQIFF
jgi:hypothetical protein